jgi:hypothetical protein
MVYVLTEFILLNTKRQDFHAIQLKTETANLIILSSYTAPSGDLNESLNLLDVLKYEYSTKSDFIISWETSIDYLKENSRQNIRTHY